MYENKVLLENKYYLSTDYTDEELNILIKERSKLNDKFYLYDQPINSLKTKEKYIIGFNHNILESGTKYLMIRSTINDELVAWLGLYDINLIDRNCELAFCLIEKYRNKDIAKDIFGIIDEYCNEYLGLKKYYYSCYSNNSGTISLAKKLDHKYIGKYTCHKYTNGIYHDLCLFEKIFIEKDNNQLSLEL